MNDLTQPEGQTGRGEVTIGINQGQLQELMALARSPSPKWNLERLDKILRLVGFVIAGSWAVLAVVLFKWESERIALEKQKLEFDISRLEAEKGQAEIENLAQQNRLAGLDVEMRQRARIKLSYELALTPLSAASEQGRRRYDIIFSYRIENIAEKPIEVDAVVVRWYLGSLEGEGQEKFVKLVNSPTERGPMKWVSESEDYVAFAYYTGRPVPSAITSGQDLEFTYGGGGTGIFAQGETNYRAIPLLVEAEVDDWIGFVVMIGIDGGVSPQNQYHIVAWEPLSRMAVDSQRKPENSTAYIKEPD